MSPLAVELSDLFFDSARLKLSDASNACAKSGRLGTENKSAPATIGRPRSVTETSGGSDDRPA